MKFRPALAAAALISSVAGYADVPELTALVPEATGYELVAKCDPRTWSRAGYQSDRSESMGGDLKRAGYLLKLVNEEDQLTWVFVSMDAFSKTVSDITVPASGKNFFQGYVDNLEVFSNAPGLKTGKFARGNIEFWSTNYSQANGKQIPGADDKSFDFGDLRVDSGTYGSMQVHNYLEKQTVFSFSNLRGGMDCDLGIGNCPGGSPDWSFAKSGKNYKNAELFIVAIIENAKPITQFQYDDATVMEKVVSLVPEAASRKLLYAYNLRTGSGFGDKTKVNYQVDNSSRYTDAPKRVGYLMLLTDAAEKDNWVYAEVDNFAGNVRQLGIPVKSAEALFQQRVENLLVKSNVASVKSGNFAYGNIEFWPSNYSPANKAAVEGASDSVCDFGDAHSGPVAGYGSMQIHNTAEKQTVFAYNRFASGIDSDAGIGNSPGKHPDWTFSGALKNYKSGWLFIVVE